MIKAHELALRQSCLNKAKADEPIFVLRAKDPVAAQAVRHWAAMALPEHEPDKIAAALALADQMDTWRENFERERDAAKRAEAEAGRPRESTPTYPATTGVAIAPVASGVLRSD